MANDPRFTPLNTLVGQLAQVVGSDFVAASDHPYTCRCDICLAWWVKMADAKDDEYGPFTQLEIETARVAGKEEDDDETGTD